ncbi:cation/multidrug efflux pump [Marinimicrobium sp. ABcell2]|uniref:cation/multidrug efflux pump n=1 Tax=Marinimicrobium sp. ABcell2 TaxID=3069751 RepID=UPI0027B85103|nr:cation/multidrug efflux pump [Marinimicrobium sp. ABcell2]MDQ2075710.1 cation/multidrug efflux pump [Marinimicrobium sp. ABcell2]
MFYTILAVFVLLLGGLLVYSAVKTLARSRWFLGWLRGMFGLALMGGAGALAMVAYDIISYKQLPKEQPVATLSFRQMGKQNYLATLVHSNGKEVEFDLRGDQWQLDARVIKWQGFVASMGVKPGYRLDRISGRYFMLEDERSVERTVYDLSDSQWRLDTWQWLRRYPQVMPLADANYSSATFVPMADNALFEVSLSSAGLLARPLNGPARDALAIWDD